VQDIKERKEVVTTYIPLTFGGKKRRLEISSHLVKIQNYSSRFVHRSLFFDALKIQFSLYFYYMDT
jgi:hypothetical protein